MSFLKDPRTNWKYILIVVFLLFVPQIGNADIAVGFLSNKPLLLVIVAFMGIWIIEALTIKNRLEGIPQKALFTALVSNLITALLGFLIFSIGTNLIKEYILPYESLVLLIIFFLLSIFTEAIVLRFYYRKENWSKITSTSFLMNTGSYLFLIVLVIGDFMVIGGAIISVILVPFFFLKSFELLTSGKKFSVSFKIVSKILIFILSIVLIILMFNRVTQRPPRRREPRIMAAMVQLRTLAVIYFDEHNSYINFGKEPEVLKLKDDIIANGGSNFAININSEGSQYCAKVQMVNGRWYCVDSELIAKEYISNPICSSNYYKCEEKVEKPEPEEEIGKEIDVEKIGKELNCGWSQNPDNCYSFLETLFQDPVSLDLIASDKKLKEYFSKNLDHLSLEEINRGKFDKYSDQEVIIVSLRASAGKHFNSYVIIIREEIKGRWRASYQNIGYFEEFFNEPRKLIKGEPEFFMGKSTPIGGTCVPVQWNTKIYRLENSSFKSIWKTIYYMDGEFEYGSGRVEKMDTTIDFKDIDGDVNFEIIKQGTKKLCKGSCYDCEEVIREEKIYQIFKWDSQKQTFVE